MRKGSIRGGVQSAGDYIGKPTLRRAGVTSCKKDLKSAREAGVFAFDCVLRLNFV